MKKIMFDDKYGLTEAVLKGRKTQTRRIVPTGLYNQTDWKAVEEGNFRSVVDGEDYRIGEVVAIAQRYSDIEDFLPFDRNFDIERGGKERTGWNNKMFVEATYMPHHIRITDVRVERLQDISDDNCIAEGITYNPCTYLDYETYSFASKDYSFVYDTAKEAYATLIDKISGKGTWDANPYVFVYEFELVD